MVLVRLTLHDNSLELLSLSWLICGSRLTCAYHSPTTRGLEGFAVEKRSPLRCFYPRNFNPLNLPPTSPPY